MLNRPKFAVNENFTLVAREQGHRELVIYRLGDGEVAEELVRTEVPGLSLMALMFRAEDELVLLTKDGRLVAMKLVISEESEASLEELWTHEFKAEITCADTRNAGAHTEILCGDQRGFVFLVDIENEPVWALGHAHRDAIVSVYFDHHRNRFVSTGRDRLIQIWTTSSQTLENAETGEISPQDVLGFFDVPEGPDGEKSEVTSDDVLEFFSMAISDHKEAEAPAKPSAPPLLKPEITLEGLEGWALAARFSSDGNRLVTGGMDNGVYLWDLSTRTLISAQFAHFGWVVDVEFSPDDSLIVSASWDNTIGMFDGHTLEARVCLEFHKDYVSDLQFIGSETLVSAGYDRQLGFWNWRVPELEKGLIAHADWIEALAPFGQGVLSVSSDGTMRTWSLSAEPIKHFGTDTSAGIELGDAVTFDEYVDAPKREWASAEAAKPSVSYRDLRTSGFSQTRSGTALSMLESAVGSAPDPIEELPPIEEAEAGHGFDQPSSGTQTTFKALGPENSAPEPEPLPEPPAPEPEPLPEPPTDLHEDTPVQEEAIPAAAVAEAPKPRLPTLPKIGAIPKPKRADQDESTPSSPPGRIVVDTPSSKPMAEPEEVGDEVSFGGVPVDPKSTMFIGASFVKKAEPKVEPAAEHEEPSSQLPSPGIGDGESIAFPMPGRPVEQEESNPRVTAFGFGPMLKGFQEPTTPAEPSEAGALSHEESDPVVDLDQLEVEPPPDFDLDIESGPIEDVSLSAADRAILDAGKDASVNQNDRTPIAFLHTNPVPDDGFVPMERGEFEPPDEMVANVSALFERVRTETSRTKVDEPEELGASTSMLDAMEEMAEELREPPKVFDVQAAELFSKRPSKPSAQASGIIRRRKRHETLSFVEKFKIRTPHEWVYAVAIHPDGDSFASCGGDNSVCIWSSTGALKQKLRVDSTGLNALGFSPDGTMLAAAGDEGVVHLWLLSQANGGVRHAKLEGHTSWVTDLVFSADSRILLSSSYDGVVRVWNLESGTTLNIYQGHQGPVAGLAHFAGKTLTAGHDGTVRVWNEQGLQIDIFDGFDMVLDCAMSPTTMAWSVANGETYIATDGQARPLLRHRGQARAMCLREDGTLLSAGEDGFVMVYDKGASEPHQSFRLNTAIWSITAHKSYLLVGADDGAIHVYGVDT
ncbi:hypothetical protein FRD01_17340 [Microvenator marinus]|uniref:Anaphase-promoting complex subunit 4 WD40 domain-containing protein n=1 Tax=Microvenator marinus TaxID=2600177 RepID=A0A5B8XTG5_9DELT|nr:hypothetical protein FRD01_17340 [Microvenator marinus]